MTNQADIQPAGPPTLAVELAGCTDVGRQRDHQEDAFAVPAAPFQAEDYERGLLLVVADGVGGLRAGDEASRLAVSVVGNAFVDQWQDDIRLTLAQAVAAANTAVYSRGQDSSSGKMATTIVCAVLRGDRMTVAHVGDSRLYRLRGGALELLTEDHSWVQMQVRLGVLTEEEARTHSRRHVVTRSLGMGPTVEIDLQHYGLRHGDRVMLCSDGLYDLVSEADVAAALIRPPHEACAALIRLANEAGGSDNITVVIAVISLTDERGVNGSVQEDEDTAERAAFRQRDEEQTAERRLLPAM